MNLEQLFWYQINIKIFQPKSVGIKILIPVKGKLCENEGNVGTVSNDEDIRYLLEGLGGFAMRKKNGDRTIIKCRD